VAVKRGFKKTGVKWRGGNFQKKLGKGKLDKKTYDDRAFTSGLVGDYTSTNFTPTTPSQRFKNSTDEKIRFTSAALSFFEFDNRTPMLFKDGDKSVFDMYFQTIVNNASKSLGYLRRHGIDNPREMKQVLMKEKIKLRHSKKFAANNNLMDWVYETKILGKDWQDQLEHDDFTIKGTKNTPIFPNEIDDMLPCFDNLFIEFCNDPILCRKTQTKIYPKVGFHIFPKKNAELVYNFRRIYFDKEGFEYQLPIIIQVDFLGKPGKQVWSKKDDFYKYVVNKELIDNFWDQPGVEEKMKEYEEIYAKDVKNCLSLLQTLNYDWIAPNKVIESEGSKQHFIHPPKGDTFEIVEIDLPKEKGYQIKDQIFGGTGIAKRRHEVRGHIRVLKDGRKVWVKPHERGNLSMGRVHKEYVLNKKGA
tara:strand:+ start:484 stop:1731 length:1248 start_codon:yes stop_codon:yes gene_type:complete